jgi:hypothetical protein
MDNNKKNNEVTFLQFLKSHIIWIIISVVFPIISSYMKHGKVEIDTVLVAFAVIMLLSFCGWKASRIKF